MSLRPVLPSFYTGKSFDQIQDRRGHCPHSSLCSCYRLLMNSSHKFPRKQRRRCRLLLIQECRMLNSLTTSAHDTAHNLGNMAGNSGRLDRILASKIGSNHTLDMSSMKDHNHRGLCSKTQQPSLANAPCRHMHRRHRAPQGHHSVRIPR